MAKKEMEILKVVGNSLLVAEEDGSKALYTKVDVDVEELAEAVADGEDDEEEEEKPAKAEKKAPAKGGKKKEDDEEEDEGDDDNDDEDEDEKLTWDEIKDMDYDELAEVIDDEELDIDAEDYDEDEDEEVEKLRKDVAKELGIEIPKKKGKK